MPPRKRLSVVSPTDPPPDPPPTQPKTVTEAATSGDARALLVAMQTRVAKAVENPNTPARDLAALTRRLIEIAREIEAIDAASKKKSVVAQTDDEAWDESAI